MTRKGFASVTSDKDMFRIVIFFVVVLSAYQLDAHIIKKEVKRNTVLCADPKMYVVAYLRESPNSINVALVYDANIFPNHSFKLLLFVGEKTLDCKYVSGVTRVDPSPVISSTYVYSNLKPGYYCARLKYKLPKAKEECPPFNTATVHVEGPEEKANTDVIILKTDKWVYAVLAASCSLIVLIAIAVLWLSRPTGGPHPDPPPYENNMKLLIEAIKTDAPVPVFLLYNYDCKHHMDVVMKLSEFLEQNYCKVSCDYREKDKIVVNKMGWIHHRLTDNFKILLVNSKKAFLKQQLWLNNRESGGNASLSGDVFLHSLSTISYQVKKKVDYKNLYMLLPSYVSKEYVLEGICPGKHYQFPLVLAKLLCHLHNVEPKTIDFKDPGMWAHCAPAFKELCCLMDSMTAYDEHGNVITHQCDPQAIRTSHV